MNEQVLPVGLGRTIYSTAWLGYRIARRAYFSLTGRNPLVRGAHTLPLSEELSSIQGTLHSKSEPPVLVRDGKPCIWKTLLGEIAVPKGLNPLYLTLIVDEQLMNVYSIGRGFKTVVDAGANIGLFTRHILSLGAEHVYAFEPSPGNAECFEYNCARELREGRITLIRRGLWNSKTTLRFATGVDDPCGHAVSDTGDTVIEVDTLDAVLAELGVEHVDFIKMDIEGSELQALEGAAGVLSRWRPRISIGTEHTRDFFANADAVIRRMDAFGYDFVCTQAQPYFSPSRNRKMMTPLCVAFYPHSGAAR